MPTNKQRRDAARRHLERQLERRQRREVRRRKVTLATSIVGTVVIIAVIVGLVVILSGNDHSTKPTASKDSSPTSTPSATPSTTPAPLPTTACQSSHAATVHFAGLTITGATDLKHEPKVAGKAPSTPTSLSCMDLVVGKGAAATSASQVTVQYVGLVYATGKVFQSSWSTGAASFAIAPGKVIPGFNQGIAGAGKVAPMRVGGRRVIVIPGAIAYAANPPQGSNIPVNAALVFVVDLQKLA